MAMLQTLRSSRGLFQLRLQGAYLILASLGELELGVQCFLQSR